MLCVCVCVCVCVPDEQCDSLALFHSFDVGEHLLYAYVVSKSVLCDVSVPVSLFSPFDAMD